MPHTTPHKSGAIRASDSGTAAPLEPIFISVKEAARILGITPWQVYKRCDEKAIESRYEGRRRLVRLESVRAYADGLPTEPQAS